MLIFFSFFDSLWYPPYCFVFPLLNTVAALLKQNFALPHYPRVGFVSLLLGC